MRSKAELRPRQQTVITNLYEEDAIRAILPMGEGKTVCALTAARELITDGHIRCGLVLAPKKVSQLVWPKEPEEWEHLAGMKIVLVVGTPAVRLRKLQEDADLYVMGIDNVQWLCEYLTTLPADHRLFDLLIIDEDTRFKNPRGKRAKALRKLAGRWKQRWGLTGTPRPRGYENLYMPLSILTADRLWGRSYDKWLRANFMPADYNGYKWSVAPWREQEIIDAAASVSITVDQTAETPGMRDVIHWVDMPEHIADEYRKMERKLIAEVWDKRGERLVSAANHAVAAGKMAQMAQGFLYDPELTGERVTVQLHQEKTDFLAELLEDLDENALVAYEFNEDLARIANLVGHDMRLGAGVNDRLTSLYEAQWNRGEIFRLPLHPASAGHGLNLQFGGRHLIWYCMTWSSELYNQTRKRIDRPGQSLACYNHLILMRDTVDEVKYDRVVNQMSEEEAFRKYMRKIA